MIEIRNKPRAREGLLKLAKILKEYEFEVSLGDRNDVLDLAFVDDGYKVYLPLTRLRRVNWESVLELTLVIEDIESDWLEAEVNHD